MSKWALISTKIGWRTPEWLAFSVRKKKKYLKMKKREIKRIGDLKPGDMFQMPNVLEPMNVVIKDKETALSDVDLKVEGETVSLVCYK